VVVTEGVSVFVGYTGIEVGVEGIGVTGNTESVGGFDVIDDMTIG
jgi:hypothetical protein